MADEHDKNASTTAAKRPKPARRPRSKRRTPTLDQTANEPVTHDAPMKVPGRPLPDYANAYCQDNEISWYDWHCLDKHSEVFRFTRGMIAFRRAHPVLIKEQFYTDAEIQWFDAQGGSPNWAEPKERQFACLIHEDEFNALYLMFNAAVDEIAFYLPATPNGCAWHLAADTSLENATRIVWRGR